MNNISFTITDKAAKRIADIIQLQKLSNDFFFRLTVEGGGCSGFQYKMAMENVIHHDDISIQKDNIKTVIDIVSAPFLDGSTLDYESSLGGSVLKVINPNATSSCGCGVSFGV
jgi:iron-sulfur cluster assembly accessory protein